jgi:hypothetical protein
MRLANDKYANIFCDCLDGWRWPVLVSEIFIFPSRYDVTEIRDLKTNVKKGQFKFGENCNYIMHVIILFTTIESKNIIYEFNNQ